ncbi:MAG: MBL fold metallo-hydrolase, partial [Microbacterium sp.]
MLSDILMPFLDLQAERPVDDYLAALRLFEDVVDDVDVVVPGHGSVGFGVLGARIDQDRAYVEAIRDGRETGDPRVGPDAPLSWLPDVHAFQVERLTR